MSCSQSAYGAEAMLLEDEGSSSWSSNDLDRLVSTVEDIHGSTNSTCGSLVVAMLGEAVRGAVTLVVATFGACLCSAQSNDSERVIVCACTLEEEVRTGLRGDAVWEEVGVAEL